jgi:hypothetical protein
MVAGRRGARTLTPLRALLRHAGQIGIQSELD